MLHLEQIADEVFAFADLKEDFSYAYIPPAARKAYLTRALGAGRQAAAQWAGRDLTAALTAAGAVIRRHSEAPAGDLHAQITWDGGTRLLELYPATARAVSEAMAETPWPLTPEQAEQLFLAHEFYHYLEYSSGHLTDEQCPPVQKRILGLFPVSAQIRRTSEIAAFAFSKAYCAWPVHPKAMDYVLANRRAGGSPDDLSDWFDRLQADYRTACGPEKEVSHHA